VTSFEQLALDPAFGPIVPSAWNAYAARQRYSITWTISSTIVIVAPTLRAAGA